MRKSQILISAWFRGHQVRRGGPSPLVPPWTGPPSSPRFSAPQQKNKYKQMKRSALLIQAYARGWKVRAGHGGGSGGSGGSACPVVGPDSSPLPVSRPSLLPLSLPLALCVCRCLLPGLPPRAVPPAPPGAEAPAPPSRSRRHHRRALEGVPGNGAARPACCLSRCPSVRLSVCPPCQAAAAVLSTGANRDRREGRVCRGGWQREGGEVLVSPPSPPLTSVPTADLSPQVRRVYRRYFRSGASACLANFIYRRLVSGAGGDTAPSQPWGCTEDPPDPPAALSPPRCRSSWWGWGGTCRRWRCWTGHGPPRRTSSWLTPTRS